MPFTRRTYAALADILTAKGHSEMSGLYYSLGVEHCDKGGNLKDRALNLVKAVEAGEAKDRSVDDATLDLLAAAARHLNWQPAADKLRHALALDGYVFADDAVIPIVAGGVTPPAALSKLEQTLDGLSLKVSAVHYRQAADNFVSGKYEAANSQLRSALEGMLQDSPTLLGKSKAGNAQAGIQALHHEQVLDKNEETFVKAFWTAVQDEGPHAGLTSETEAAFRFHMASAVMAYLITKIAGTK